MVSTEVKIVDTSAKPRAELLYCVLLRHPRRWGLCEVVRVWGMRGRRMRRRRMRRRRMRGRRMRGRKMREMRKRKLREMRGHTKGQISRAENELRLRTQSPKVRHVSPY